MSWTRNEKEIKNLLKGAIAERLFEELHRELNCVVYRSGQEVLYQGMFDVVRIRRNRAVRNLQNIDVSAARLTKLTENQLKALAKQIKGDRQSALVHWPKEFNTAYFTKEKNTSISELENREYFATTISSTPDFTIVRPNGNMELFEVKFRKDGKLWESDKKKYLEHHNSAKIFIVMAVEPYIKILHPHLDEDEMNVVDDALMDANGIRMGQEGYNPDTVSASMHHFHLKNKHYTEEYWSLYYSPEILQRYRLIVRDFFDSFNGYQQI